MRTEVVSIDPITTDWSEVLISVFVTGHSHKAIEDQWHMTAPWTKPKKSEFVWTKLDSENYDFNPHIIAAIELEAKSHRAAWLIENRKTSELARLCKDLGVTAQHLYENPYNR